jgi:hypothetical protein
MAMASIIKYATCLIIFITSTVYAEDKKEEKQVEKKETTTVIKDSKGRPLPVCNPIQVPEKDNCRKMTYSQRAGGSQRD